MGERETEVEKDEYKESKADARVRKNKGRKSKVKKSKVRGKEKKTEGNKERKGDSGIAVMELTK